MVGNPYRWKATVTQLENRNATAGCLLTILFVVPYLVKCGYNIWTLLFLSLVYIGVIVPLLTGILPKKTFIHFLRYLYNNYLAVFNWIIIFPRIWGLIKSCHYLYLDLDNIHTTTKQIIFNIAAERFICPDQKLCSLFVLLFYSVLAYLQKALYARPWAVLFRETSTKEFLKLTTAFIVVRLGKGVAMSLVLITFTLQFNHLEPTFSYIILTFSYFCITQYEHTAFIRSTFEQFLKYLQFQYIEGWESEWVPVLLTVLTVLPAIIVTVGLFFHGSYVTSFILCYLGVVIPVLKMLESDWAMLRDQMHVLDKFPKATWKNPKIKEGHPCAICLEKMHIFGARVTPCGHVFHGSCLRACINYSSYCPLCKSQMIM